MRFPAAAALLAVSSATVSIPQPVLDAAVSWPDADWPAELGSLPLGSGDVSANAWIERSSGDLLLYVAKSDAFDANALPIKLARLRLRFLPALWTAATPNASGWAMNLSVAEAAVSIRAPGGYSVRLLIDANSGALRVSASHAAAAFDVSASLELVDEAANWNRATVRDYASMSSLNLFNHSPAVPNQNAGGFGSYCLERFLEPDTVVAAADAVALGLGSLAGRVSWYHRNVDTQEEHKVPSYFDNVMRGQGLNPEQFEDPLLHRTFGGSLGGI